MQKTEEQRNKQTSEDASTTDLVDIESRTISWKRIWKRYRRLASQRFNRQCETARSAAVGGFWSAIIAVPAALFFASSWTVPLFFILFVGFAMHLFVGYFSRKQREYFVPAHTLTGAAGIGILATVGYLSGEIGLLFAGFYAMMIAVHLPLLGYVLGYFVSDLQRLDLDEAREQAERASGGDDWGKI